MTEYQTSPELEKIVERFSLCLFEILEWHDGTALLRFNFSAEADEGGDVFAGELMRHFERNESPRAFAEKLRAMADILDKSWATSFPTALEKDNG